MLIPKKHRVAIYSYLFKEGVLVAKKDTTSKHDKIEVPNLHVLKALLSLKSRGYVHEIFSWQHFFWTLTNEGIEYLREYLHVPADFVPATLKKQTKPQPRPSFRRIDEGGRGRGRGRGDRDDYRGPKKTDGAPEDFQPSFDGGRGRGRGRGGFRRGDAETGGAAAGGASDEAPRRGRGGFRGGRGARGPQ